MSLYEYRNGDTLFEGYLVIDQNQKIKRSCVMVAHAWDGPTDHFNSLADNLSERGFIDDEKAHKRSELSINTLLEKIFK